VWVHLLRSGRRSFKGNELYAEVFAKYVKVLLKEGLPLEFFIEGGRSRTGKMVMPKYGILSMIIDAYREKACEDLAAIPVYIGYDRVIEDFGIRREVFLTTPHFLVVPLVIENTDLIATVPRELGTVFSRYKCIKVWPTPIELPRFDLRQHWHPRYHHDSANKWLRNLVLDAFRDYPE